MSDNMKTNRPYILRAFLDWIVDNDLTPYCMIDAEYPDTEVPSDYIKDGRIVLDVSGHATRNFRLTNDALYFEATFQGELQTIHTPIRAVLALYAKENGRGIFFDDAEDGDDDWHHDMTSKTISKTDSGEVKKEKIKRKNTTLKIVK